MTKKNLLMMYIPGILVSITCLLITQFLPESIIMSRSIAILLIVSFLFTIQNVIRIYNNVLNPIGIFSIVWLLLIPITSFEFPIMPEMTFLQWKYVSVFILVFYLGAIISEFLLKPIKLSNISRNPKIELNSLQKYFLFGILLMSIGIYLFLAERSGGFPALSADPDYARRSFFLPGTATLANLGMMSVFFLIMDEKFRKNKVFLLLIVIYFIELYLIAVRFGIMMLLLMLLSVLSIQKLSTVTIQRLIIVGGFTVVLFVTIANIRGGNIDKYSFFAGYGYYSGSERWLQNSEFFRYIGYSQRLMEKYVTQFTGGSNYGQYTLQGFFPFLVNENNFVEHLSIFGYTATNMISYLFLDFGNFWIIVAFIWAIIVCYSYKVLRIYPGNIVVRYLWTLSMITIVFSYYAYFHSYSLWIGNFTIFSITTLYLGRIRIR